jgi:hypothetical protein
MSPHFDKLLQINTQAAIYYYLFNGSEALVEIMKCKYEKNPTKVHWPHISSQSLA